MAYPDLPPSPTFWRCPSCGNESTFQAAGVGHVECVACHAVSTVDALKATHTQAHPPAPASAA